MSSTCWQSDDGCSLWSNIGLCCNPQKLLSVSIDNCLMKLIKQNVGKKDGCMVMVNSSSQEICGLLMPLLQFSGPPWHFKKVEACRLKRERLNITWLRFATK